jgi:hypothetical protein
MGKGFGTAPVAEAQPIADSASAKLASAAAQIFIIRLRSYRRFGRATAVGANH